MPDDVHKSGWLEKQSSAKGIFANTRKRYFVLYDHTLKYYAKPEDTTPKGEVPIGMDTSVDLHSGKHAFSIEAPNVKELVLIAPNEVVMHEWMHALQARVDEGGAAAQTYDDGAGRPNATGRPSLMGSVMGRSSISSSVTSRGPAGSVDSNASSTFASSMFGGSMMATYRPRDHSGSLSSAQSIVVSEDDREFATRLADGDEQVFVRWIRKIREVKHHGSSQLRLFVLSKYFVFSVKRSVTGTYQVQRQAHLYALNFFGHTADDENVVRLKFRDPSVEGMNKEFELLMVEDDLDTSLELCHEVHAATMRISYNFPEGRMPHMSMHTAELLLDEINGYTDAKLWEDNPPIVCTNTAYFAICKQIGVQP